MPMEKKAEFTFNLDFIENKDLALAGIAEEYNNPLLTWIKLIFSDDQPNANKQGIKQSEFPNLIKSMAYMPIKANFESESGLEGHSGAKQIGLIKEGQQQGNKVVAIGALYNDEFPDVVEFFKKEIAEGKRIDFSWEIRYKDAIEEEGIEWLTETTTKAVTAVQDPAYEGRTPLISISSFDLVKMIDEELKEREKIVKEDLR
jgi:hypothetical protein